MQGHSQTRKSRWNVVPWQKDTRKLLLDKEWEFLHWKISSSPEVFGTKPTKESKMQRSRDLSQGKHWDLKAKTHKKAESGMWHPIANPTNGLHISCMYLPSTSGWTQLKGRLTGSSNQLIVAAAAAEAGYHLKNKWNFLVFLIQMKTMSQHVIRKDDISRQRKAIDN